MKKILSAFLTIAFLLSFSSTAFAYNDSGETKDSKKSETIILKHEGHGTYKKTQDKNENTITATATEDADIYHIKDAQYVTAVGNDKYLLVDRLDIVIDDFSKNTPSLQKYKVPAEICEEMKKNIAIQKELGNKDLEIAVFAPSLAKTTESNELTQNSGMITGFGLSNTYGMLTENGLQKLYEEVLPTQYYTYNGYSMKDYMVKYWHNHTPVIEKNGNTALSNAATFINFGVTIAGTFINLPAFVVYGIGTSALDVYEIFNGPVVYGTSGDYMYTMVTYDYITKWTYVWSSNIWQLGCMSEKYWLDQQATTQFFASNGDIEQTTVTLNAPYNTENYNYPAPTAVQYMGYVWVDEPLRLRIYDTTVVF